MESTVEFFIDKVRLRPCLWNHNHVSYRDMGRKDLAWERIAKECGMANGREAKVQWKKLRDSHREALRRRKPSHGPSAQYLRPWKYEEDMKFLLLQMESKETTFYSNDSNDLEDNCNESIMDMSNETKDVAVLMPKPLIPSQESFNETMYTEPDRKRDIADILEEREKLREERERRRDKLLRQVVESNRGDALSKFFDSLYQKTRELPKYLQLRIQREIFESVTRAEEEALALNHNSINGYAVPTSSSQRQSAATISSEPQEEEDYAIEPEYEKKFSVDD